MFGDNAAPVSPLRLKDFRRVFLTWLTSFPQWIWFWSVMTIMIILTMAAFRSLRSKTKQFYVALWSGQAFDQMGVMPTVSLSLIGGRRHKQVHWKYHLHTQQAFFGKGNYGSCQIDVGGWVIQTAQEKIWFSGDGGYGKHFTEIGRRLGPFDLGFIECGQYNEMWHQIHMYPEEGVVAALEAGASKVMPVHWEALLWPCTIGRSQWIGLWTKLWNAIFQMILPAQGTPASLHYEFNEGWWQGIIWKENNL